MYDRVMPLASPERKIDVENNKRIVMEAYGK
jgi:hypothetical protein